MLGSSLKASLLVMMMSLCVGVPIVSAEGVLSGWTSTTTIWLTSVTMVSADDGWAVGDGGVIIRWNGTAWSNVTSPVTRALWSVVMVGADDGWVVGGGERCYVGMQRNGVTLQAPQRIGSIQCL